MNSSPEEAAALVCGLLCTLLLWTCHVTDIKLSRQREFDGGRRLLGFLLFPMEYEALWFCWVGSWPLSERHAMSNCLQFFKIEMNTASAHCFNYLLFVFRGKNLNDSTEEHSKNIIHFEKELLPFRSPMLNGVHTNMTSLSRLHLHIVWWLLPRISFWKGRIQINKHAWEPSCPQIGQWGQWPLSKC